MNFISSNSENSDKKIYDCVVLGSGPINILEAVASSQSGLEVLLIDESSEIGGAWKSLSIFGFDNVENAIHYIMYDKDGYDFIEKFLNVPIIYSCKKYFAISFLFFNFKLNYNGLIGHFFHALFNNRLVPIYRRILNARRAHKYRFKYFKNGSTALLEKLCSMVNSSNVNVRLNTKITSLKIYNNDVTSHAILSDESIIYFKKLVITSGALLSDITLNDIPYIVKKEIIHRPQIHILIQEPRSDLIFDEIIFSNDNLLKYVHDVTRFASSNLFSADKQKIFVVALSDGVNLSNNIDKLIFNRLKKYKLISGNALLLDSKCWNIFLPELVPKELERIKKDLQPDIDVIVTENLGPGLSLNSSRWHNMQSSKSNFKG